MGSSNTSGTATYSGTLALHDNVRITSASGGTVSFTGQIQNGSLTGLNNQTLVRVSVKIGGGVTLNGTGTVILSGSNSYVGGTTLNTGSILGIGNDSALGTGRTSRLTQRTRPSSPRAGASDIANNLTLSNGSPHLHRLKRAYDQRNNHRERRNKLDISTTRSQLSLPRYLGGQRLLWRKTIPSRAHLQFGSGATASQGTTLISGVVANNSGANTLASNLVVGGGGKVILAGNNTYTGTTHHSKHGTILQIGNGGKTGSLGSGT